MIVKKHGKKYEQMSWNVIDDGTVDLIEDDLGGLLDGSEDSDSEE